MTKFKTTYPLFKQLEQAYRYFTHDPDRYMRDANWPTFYDKLNQALAVEASERRAGATGCVGGCDGPVNCTWCAEKAKVA